MERDARAVLTSGDLPLSQLWPHLVLGLLLARREAPLDNRHLDELWRLVTRLDNPGTVASAAAALAENAWITRRPDIRLDGVLVTGLFTHSYAGKDAALKPLRRWSRRLADAGVRQVGPPWSEPSSEPSPEPATHHEPATEASADQPHEWAMALWDAGSTADLLAALPPLDALDARAVAALVRSRLRGSGVSAVPRGSLPATRANPAGLTARQFDVLSLLSDGLSNADIVARLAISRKTADHHVSAILSKMDVRSRSEAAAAERRLGV